MTTEQGIQQWPIVNTAFAKKYFGGSSAIGHHLRESPTAPWTTIVEEIGDIRNMSLEAAVVPQNRRDNLVVQ